MSPASIEVRSLERDALVALYDATGGANWTNNTNWLSDEPMGEWHGVTTDEEGRVFGLSLTENQLSGEIPAGLGSLPNLQWLRLNENELTGEIPGELGSLSSLQSLDLGGNRLTGEIPTELGKLSNLESLFLNYNELTGEIPTDLGGLSNLTVLDLGANRLNGEIPRELGNLSSLTHLYFGTNQLTGRIPPELGKLSNLRDLALNSSRLTGEIPTELGNLSDLEKLYLHENLLTGEIPTELGNLSDLEKLYLHENLLTGEIPEELSRLSRLTRLHLENNRLAGELPKSLTALTMLERLLFNDNAGLCAPTDEAFQAWLQTIASVSGRNCGVADSQEDRAVLVELYNATGGANWTDNTNWLSDEPLDTWYGVRTGGDGRVNELELSNNGLRGEIPDEVGTLTRLEALNLGYNEMTGPLSAWVGDLRHLRRLQLAGNVFHGELPAELGSLPRLEVLTLAGSAGFFGKLPEALTKANKLRWLTFHGTALCAPLDEDFREWLDGLSEWRGSDCPPGSKDLSMSTEAQYPITMREHGYGYTIDIPDDWRENELSIREFDLPAETTLAQFAESVRNDLKRRFSASAFVFEITSFEKRHSTDQGSYIIEYRHREDPDHCMENVVEQIALVSSLPGPARGYRLKHEVCDWELSTELDRVRRETLDSFRTVTNADAYYHQFISRPGVIIKAPGRVDPEALQESAEILDVMLDGRQDIPDCLGRIGSALAIVPDGDPLTALPEFSYLKDVEGEWGLYYNSTHAPGAGGHQDSPVSATPEQMLRGPAGYSPFRDVHEPGHHVQLCFNESDNLRWMDLYWEAIEKVGSVDEYDPISELVSSNSYEFWAGFSSFYFFVHYAPRRYAKQLFPEAFAFVESIYGKLTPTESDHPGYVQYVTASGHALPWLVPGGNYENDTFGYRIELLPGWVVKKESSHELLLVSRNWPWPTIRVHYTRLSDRLSADDALVWLGESRRLDWQQKTRGWHRSEVKSFERGALDGDDTYWIHFYGQERPGGCEVDVIERVLLAKHGGDNYGVVLEGSACGEGNDYAIQDFGTMLRSFILPTSKRAPTPESTPTPTPETDSSELAGSERDALVALYNSTGGERWHNNENWLSDKPLDTWYGVRTVGGRVTKLFLSGNGLRGEIPAELGNLTHLRELWFGDDNYLTGELPSELSDLTRLEVLELRGGEMSGPIPAWLGELKRLRSLYLDNNRFEGELPAEFGKLSRLEILTLFGNRGLVGALPEALTGIKELWWFPFHETGLCAPVAESFQAWLLNVPYREGPDCLPGTTERVIVRDVFGREVNETGIVLVDWEGHIANPLMKYSVELPGATALLSSSEPRLYFDLPSSTGANGPTKALGSEDPTQATEFHISIFPDRDTFDETHTLTIRYVGGGGQIRSQTIDVHVIDQDTDRNLDFNVTTDFSQDQTGLFGDSNARESFQTAANDWAYYIDDMNLDEVQADQEQSWVWDSRGYSFGGKLVRNTESYTGFLLYGYGIDDGTGGQPSDWSYQTADGESLPLRRSGNISMSKDGNFNTLGWNASLPDEEWWKATNVSSVQNDLYSIALHEIGHALVFNPGYDEFAKFKEKGYIDDPSVVEYYGASPRISPGLPDHLPDTIDPVSKRGAYGNEYGGEMPLGRWLLTKGHVLIAQAVGYTLRDTSPFRQLFILDEPLSEGSVGAGYTHKVNVVGGIPAYYWTIDSGALPDGLSLDSFTGIISGTSQESGTFEFTIRVRDNTEGNPGVVRAVTLNVNTHASDQSD